jgi:hypothetical protein
MSTAVAVLMKRVSYVCLTWGIRLAQHLPATRFEKYPVLPRDHLTFKFIRADETTIFGSNMPAYCLHISCREYIGLSKGLAPRLLTLIDARSWVSKLV